MIQFKCPKCQTVLKFADDKAGTVVVCKECKAKLKAPTPKKTSPEAERKKKPADDIEEVVPTDDDAPRKKRPARDDDDDIDLEAMNRPGKKKAARDDDDDVEIDLDSMNRQGKKKPARRRDEDDLDDEDDRPRRKRRRRDDDDEPSGKNVVSGIVYILLGLVVAGVGLVAPMYMDLAIDETIPMIFGPVAGLLLAGLGIFYIVRK